MTKRSELNFPAIYTITHTASGKTYVGQTTNLRIRWQMHRSDLRKGRHRNTHLQNAWNKHGKDAFEFSVYRNMSDTPPEQLADALNKLEIELLSTISEPYNLMVAGESGTVASAETRAKLSKLRTATWADPAFRQKQGDAIRGLYADAEWKAERDAAVKAGKNTPKTKAAVSAQMTSLWESDEHRATQSAKRTKNWQDPIYQAQQAASRLAAWADPEIRERRLTALREAASRPEVIEARKEGQKRSLDKMSAAKRSNWADPEWRARTIAAQNAGRAARKAAKSD